ncbi:MAG: hypothetical protein Q9172_002347 [Xanthocarpia lactea]
MEDPNQQASIETGPQRIRVLPGASDTAASFQFDQEDHTLGNALRFMIMKKGRALRVFNPTSLGGQDEPKNPDLRQADVPLRSSRRLTHGLSAEGTTVYDALEKGFDDLMDLCDVVTMKFTASRDDFAASMDTQ